MQIQGLFFWALLDSGQDRSGQKCLFLMTFTKDLDYRHPTYICLILSIYIWNFIKSVCVELRMLTSCCSSDIVPLQLLFHLPLKHISLSQSLVMFDTCSVLIPRNCFYFDFIAVRSFCIMLIGDVIVLFEYGALYNSQHEFFVAYVVLLSCTGLFFPLKTQVCDS